MEAHDPEEKLHSVEETSIPPERIERILDRVVDIHEKGTAFSRIGFLRYSSVETASAGFSYDAKWKKIVDSVAGKLNRGEIDSVQYRTLLDEENDKLDQDILSEIEGEYVELRSVVKDILQHGVIGRSKLHAQGARISGKDSGEIYRDLLERTDIVSPVVYANIVGRSDPRPSKDSAYPIKDSHWNLGDFCVNILIDADHYDEKNPGSRTTGLSIIDGKWTYRADDGQVYKDFEKIRELHPDIEVGDPRLSNYGRNSLGGVGFDEEGMPRPLQEYGFVFFPRVPVRFIKGIVIKATSESDKVRMREIIELVVQASKHNPHMLIPVYNAEGDLLWPQEISHDEIVKIRKEKD